VSHLPRALEDLGAANEDPQLCAPAVPTMSAVGGRQPEGAGEAMMRTADRSGESVRRIAGGDEPPAERRK
jgi:hypothetical protein